MIAVKAPNLCRTYDPFTNFSPVCPWVLVPSLTSSTVSYYMLQIGSAFYLSTVDSCDAVIYSRTGDTFTKVAAFPLTGTEREPLFAAGGAPYVEQIGLFWYYVSSNSSKPRRFPPRYTDSFWSTTSRPSFIISVGGPMIPLTWTSPATTAAGEIFLTFQFPALWASDAAEAGTYTPVPLAVPTASTPGLTHSVTPAKRIIIGAEEPASGLLAEVSRWL